MREKLDALDEAGYISWPEKPDGFPRYKKYLNRAKGSRWATCGQISMSSIHRRMERTGFPRRSQKPCSAGSLT